jgi:hypothetical protein
MKKRRFPMRYQESRVPGQEVAKAWRLKKDSLLGDLDAAAKKSPILVPLAATDHGPEVRFVVAFLIPTLIRPGPRGEVRTGGPVIVGIRYHEEFLAAPPVSWEVACVLSPGTEFYHPNANGGRGVQGVCLGPLPSAVGMEAILCQLHSGLVLASGVVNTVEWQGLHPEAAAYVRAQDPAAFPLVPTGLYEAPPPGLLRPLHLAGLDLLAATGFAAEALP